MSAAVKSGCLGAGLCIGTVSYTHLDVYKRQILYHPKGLIANGYIIFIYKSSGLVCLYKEGCIQFGKREKNKYSRAFLICMLKRCRRIDG